MLEAREVICTRGERPLFKPVSFRLEPGQILQIRGPNGRGKTTLLRALAGLSWFSDGAIGWKGEPIQHLGDDYRKDLLYLGHLNGLHGELTPLENLRFAAALAVGDRRLATAEAALATVGLGVVGDLGTRYLSQGQKRRVALARLALNQAPLWLLDEPFAALDVRSVEVLAATLGIHLARGGLVVLISHQEVAIAGDRQDLTLEAPQRSRVVA